MSSEMLQVSEQTLLQRVNKILAKKSNKLFKSRTESEKNNMGTWYLTGTNKTFVIASHCDLEKIGRETGELKIYECLVEA